MSLKTAKYNRTIYIPYKLLKSAAHGKKNGS